MGDGHGRSQTSVACYRIRSGDGGTRTIPHDGGVLLPVRPEGSTRDVLELAVHNRFGAATLLRNGAEQLCVPAEIVSRGQVAP